MRRNINKPYYRVNAIHKLGKQAQNQLLTSSSIRVILGILGTNYILILLAFLPDMANATAISVW